MSIRIAANSLVSPNEFGTSSQSQVSRISASQSATHTGNEDATELYLPYKRLSILKQSDGAFSGSLGISPSQSSSQVAGAANALNLGGLPATVAQIQSAESVNATPTSYTPNRPEFSGSSTSVPTVSGVYDGANETTTLTLSIVASGALGRERDLEVRDDQNTLVDTLDLPAWPQDVQFDLSNGLTLDLSAGTFALGDSFTVDVFESVGESVDPNKPFNGMFESSPRFEKGVTVTSGAFSINGTVISVLEGDTIETVLQRINESSAGVTATFNAVSERVELTQNNTGVDATISFGADSSGFLAAVKLDSAIVDPGTDATQGADDLVRLAGDINRLFEDVPEGGFGGQAIENLRTAIEQTVLGSSEDRVIKLTDRLTLDLRSNDGPVLEVGSNQQLAQSTYSEASEVNVAMLGDDDGGLIDRLLNLFGDAEVELGARLARTGSLVDQQA